MDFNPEDARQYLEGAEYPASKEDLISAAQGTMPRRPCWTGAGPWAATSSPARRSWKNYGLPLSRRDRVSSPRPAFSGPYLE